MSVQNEKSLSATDCPSCWEELGDSRIPYSLTCGHTLCINCIKRLAQSSPQFSCSLCREIVPLSSVKRNFTLCQLLSQLKITKSGAFNPALTTPFDSIKLEQLLDRGASGEVHRGVWQNNDVAVKIFASGQISPQIQDSFRREVCVMSSLRHPNVVLLLAACPDPPRLAIVMEFVRGGSLYSHIYITKTPLETQDMIKLMIDISRGLQYLHSINILHRDLKSKNVLLSSSPPNCQAKLCDFGLARIRLESATMTGSIGTVHWTAPEVLNCARYHFAADVYGLGMVIYEIITGTLPFSGLPPPAVIVAVLLRREKPKIPPYCDKELSQLLTSCITWEADNRPSISSVLHQLYSLLDPTDTSFTDTDNGVSHFDHIDSLGNVVVEVELDETDIDSDLMDFLLAAQNEEEQTNINTEEDAGDEDNDDKTDHKDFDSPLFIPTNNVGGILSDQELSNISRSPFTSSMNSISSNVPNDMPLAEENLPVVPTRPDPTPPQYVSTPPKYSKTYRRRQKDVPELVVSKFAVPQYNNIVSNRMKEHGGPAMSQQQQFESISNIPKKTLSDPSPYNTRTYSKMQHPLHSHSEEDKHLQSQISHDSSLYKHKTSHKTKQHEEVLTKRSKKDNRHSLPSQNRDISPLRLESGGVLNWAEGIDDYELLKKNVDTPPYSMSTSSVSTEDDDFELAQAILRQEQKEIALDDYQLASRLQHQYTQSNVLPPLPPRSPPPLPPSLLPINHLPIMPTKNQLLMSHISTLGRYRKLKPVRTVEKRGVRLGKVVDGFGNEKSQNTVQNEILNFSKTLLFQVELKEPPPFHPVGRVVELKPDPYVRKVVERMNSEIHRYDKKLMRHISYIEKNPLPTAEVIKSEKDTVIETIPETSTDIPLGQQHSNNNESDVLEKVILETPSSVEQEASLPPVKTKKVSARPANVARQHPNTKGSKMTSSSPSTSANVNTHKVTSSVKANTKLPNNKTAMKPPLRDSTTSDHKVKKPVPMAAVDRFSSDTSKHEIHVHDVHEKSQTNSNKKKISETPAKNVTPSQDEVSISLTKPSSIDVEKQPPIPRDGITTATGTHEPVLDPSITKKVGIKKKKK